MATDYQCVLAPDGAWHLIQEQSNPPPITRGGGQTMCAAGWCEFKRGYERRRPTCAACLAECVKDETRREKKYIEQCATMDTRVATQLRTPRALADRFVVPTVAAFVRTPRRL